MKHLLFIVIGLILTSCYAEQAASGSDLPEWEKPLLSSSPPMQAPIELVRDDVVVIIKFYSLEELQVVAQEHGIGDYVQGFAKIDYPICSIFTTPDWKTVIHELRHCFGEHRHVDDLPF